MNEKLRKALAALVAEMEKPPAERDEKIFGGTMAAIREGLKEAGADGPGAFEVFKAHVQKEMDRMAEDLRRLAKMGLERRGTNLVPLGRAQRLEMLKDNRCFLDRETSRRFGALVTRSIFQKYPGRYEEMIPEKTRDFAAEIAKELDPTVGSAGEYLIADEFRAELIANLEAVGTAFPLCRRVPLGTTGLTYFPKLIGELTATPTAAGTKIGESAPTFGIIPMQPVKWGTLTPIPNEFFRNTALLADLGQLVGLLMIRAISTAFDNAVLNGDGSADFGGITGLLKSATIADVTAAVHSTGATLDGTDVSAVVAGITKDYAIRDAQWLMSLSMALTLRALKTTTGQLLYPILGATGLPDAIDNFPYRICQKMPAVSAVTASKQWSLFGRIDLAYYFGLLGNIDVATSSEVYFDKDMTVVRGLAYADAKEVDATAVIRGKTHA